MNIYKTAVNNPITTILVFIAVALFGIFSLVKLPIDFMPRIDTPYIMVITAYPGASAEDIEENVSKPLENSLNGVENLKHISSRSKENISVVSLQFEYGTDNDVATNDVRDKLDMAKNNLPDEVNNPILFKFSTDEMPIMLLSVKAEESWSGLYKIIDEQVATPLARVGGVGTVSVQGIPERQIQVYCDPYKLEAYGVTIEGTGGGVSIYSGKFGMKGGTVGNSNAQSVATTSGYSNKATYGGGIGVFGSGELKLSGGKINYNYATKRGGGIYIEGRSQGSYSSAKMIVSGNATVSYNTTDKYTYEDYNKYFGGGGVYVWTNLSNERKVFRENDAVITVTKNNSYWGRGIMVAFNGKEEDYKPNQIVQNAWVIFSWSENTGSEFEEYLSTWYK